jgi:hypothetical protein
MAAKKSKVQKVMHEYKTGTLHSGKDGKVVKSKKQAVAIALSEAGYDNYPKKRQAKQAVHRKYNKDKQFYKA